MDLQRATKPSSVAVGLDRPGSGCLLDVCLRGPDWRGSYPGYGVVGRDELGGGERGIKSETSAK